ncbi:hypothetical protein HDU91_002821 [Kappamyces sp. JEL0680]|nr:hypothetical protein HDU91_002821 [Kappamyces sp. JEL0680]
MTKTLNLALIGPGLVGKEFLAQIKQFRSDSVSLRVVAVMSSKLMKCDASGLSDVSLSGSGTKPASLSEFIQFATTCVPCVLVDCTSSDEVASQYPHILKRLHLVTPNKKGFSGGMELWDNIQAASKSHGTLALHESTVGAGLPIISTLKDLVATGDEIVKIEGIFSGTLSFIFNQFSQLGQGADRTFSAIVKEAKSLGYTEPDPRDDLNGMDVARKVIILGRVAGSRISMETLKVENIVPEELRQIRDAETFLEQLSAHDEYFQRLNAQALSENSVLRYVGYVDPNGESSVSLKKYPASHPFASLKGSDNIISFTTKRFPNSLIVQGAGAGAAVTAFGMFSDVLKIAGHC